MKTYILLLLTLMVPVLLLNEATAESAPAEVRTFKEMLKAIPSKDILKLWGDKKVALAAAMSKQINAKEVGKVGTYRGKVSKIDPFAFPEKNIVGWRFAVEDNFKRGGDTFSVFAWVMVHTDPLGLIPKIRVGDEITVTGKVNRAELTAVDAPRLNVDLIVPVMNDGKSTGEKVTVDKPTSKPGAPAASVKMADYPLDRILDALPEAMRTKLSTEPLPRDAIPAINAALAALAVRKSFKFTFNVEVATVVPDQPEAFRIRPADGLLSGKYAAIRQQWVHLYLPTAKAGDLVKTAAGDTLTMTGNITRCDIITHPKGFLQLQVNLDNAQKVTAP